MPLRSKAVAVGENRHIEHVEMKCWSALLFMIFKYYWASLKDRREGGDRAVTKRGNQGYIGVVVGSQANFPSCFYFERPLYGLAGLFYVLFHDSKVLIIRHNHSNYLLSLLFP